MYRYQSSRKILGLFVLILVAQAQVFQELCRSIYYGVDLPLQVTRRYVKVGLSWEYG